MDFKGILISSLSITRDNYKTTGETFKFRAYDKVIKNIEKIIVPIKTFKDVENIDGIGKSIKTKIKEIFDKGEKEVQEKITENSEKKNKKPKLIEQLLNVYGIGPAKAKTLIETNKVQSIEDLKKKSDKDEKLLTRAQKIGLLCYDDLLERIPREEMLKHEKILYLSKEKGEIVGSFRRKNPDSGDIDVMLNMNIEEFENFIEKLKKKGYLQYILAKGKSKMLGICSIKDGKYRRLDLIRNSEEEYPFMKLYFTGSQEFNVAFRQHCLTLGLSLNEHSFTPKVDNLKTEEDIFKHVGLKYVEPENRIGNDSIIKL
jgi:DNA polymerase/3'-5' exonuclease PolX